jgi:penicillin-binding protein 1A
MRTTRRWALVTCAAALALLSCAQIDDLPTLTPADLRFKPAQSSKILASDGAILTTLHGVEDRTVVPLAQIPEHFRRAVVAIEDERFYEHSGVDLRAVIRAAVANATSGEIREGGSTITQQYVKNVIIAPGETAARTLERKIDEAALARQMERRLSKQEILARYLNTVYFGNGAYGAQAAAQTYFGKSVTRLDLAESALLAALIRSPEDYDPFERPKRGRARRDLVLDRMVELGWTSPARAAKVSAQDIRLNPDPEKKRYPAPYFVDYVRRLIKYDDRFHKVGRTPRQRERQLFNGGLRIHTTVDLEMQAAAEHAARTVLPRPNDPHASLVAIDPRTGEVKAMVGGRDWFARDRRDRFAKLNLAITGEPGLGARDSGGHSAGTGRQAGSAFKPFALAQAIEEGIPLSKTYDAAPCMDFPGLNNGGPWRVCNYEGTSFGGSLSLFEATVNSVNVVYAQLIVDVGPEDVVERARRMGINTPLEPVHAAVLGSNPVNPLGMASAYGTLATTGRHHPPVAITRIEDARGNTLYKDRSEPRRALSPAASYLTTSALEQVMQRGTGVGAAIGRPAAGKTGTAQEYRDAWFVGYTPDLVAAVWVGYPEGEIEMKPSCVGSTQPCRPTRTATSGGVTGGSWPASIWRLFMLSALSDVPAHSFPVPPGGFVEVNIDTRNGCLAGPYTPPEYVDYAVPFPEGAQPTRSCIEPGDVERVPDVAGFPVGKAIDVLSRAGFAVDKKEKFTTTYPPGTVIGITPNAGTRVRSGSTVTIIVSTREAKTVRVPDVLGMARAQAVAAIQADGFEARVIEQKESDKQDAQRNQGRVWQQRPAGGTKAERGSTVTIWVNPD